MFKQLLSAEHFKGNQVRFGLNLTWNWNEAKGRKFDKVDTIKIDAAVKLVYIPLLYGNRLKCQYFLFNKRRIVCSNTIFWIFVTILRLVTSFGQPQYFGRHLPDLHSFQSFYNLLKTYY